MEERHYMILDDQFGVFCEEEHAPPIRLKLCDTDVYELKQDYITKPCPAHQDTLNLLHDIAAQEETTLDALISQGEYVRFSLIRPEEWWVSAEQNESSIVPWVRQLDALVVIEIEYGTLCFLRSKHGDAPRLVTITDDNWLPYLREMYEDEEQCCKLLVSKNDYVQLLARSLAHAVECVEHRDIIVAEAYQIMPDWETGQGVRVDPRRRND